jgi:ankyrin repeat protein
MKLLNMKVAAYSASDFNSAKYMKPVATNDGSDDNDASEQLQSSAIVSPNAKLFAAVQASDFDTFADLLHGEAEFVDLNNARNQEDSTLLIQAAAHGCIDVTDFLLEYGVAVDDTDPRGGTALTYAAVNGHILCVEQLLAHNANVEHRDHHGVTPLIYASAHGEAEVVDILISHGVDVNAQDNEGMTALMRATQMHRAHGVSRVPVIDKLMAAGADAEIRDKSGHSALSQAPSKLRVRFVEEEDSKVKVRQTDRIVDDIADVISELAKHQAVEARQAEDAHGMSLSQSQRFEEHMLQQRQSKNDMSTDIRSQLTDMVQDVPAEPVHASDSAPSSTITSSRSAQTAVTRQPSNARSVRSSSLSFLSPNDQSFYDRYVL